MADLKDIAKSLGAYTASTTERELYAQVLIVGQSKAGKTTSVVTTCPGPVGVLNADGSSSLNYAKGQGFENYIAWDIDTIEKWKSSTAKAKRAAQEGIIKSIVVDSASLLSSHISDQLLAQVQPGQDPRKVVWGPLGEHLRAGFRRLLSAPAHLFIIAHMDPTSEVDITGILPMIQGGTKGWLPAIIQDWVLFEIEPGRKPHERMFLVGPQKKWTHGARNARRTCAIPADVGELLKELKLTKENEE